MSKSTQRRCRVDSVDAARDEITRSIPKDRTEYWDGYRQALSTFEKAIRRKMSETKEHERKCWDCEGTKGSR
jgi:hypothetical protein